jgi:hypothetical protein
MPHSQKNVKCVEHPATDLNFPQEYLKIVPHPHSRNPTTQIILLSTSSKETLAFQPKPSVCPWAPFKNIVDFEYTETAIKGLLSKELVNTQLARINSTWAVGGFLSIKSHRDMEKIFSKACTYFVQVCNYILRRRLQYYELTYKLNISSRAKPSQPRTKINLEKLLLSIEILGNGSWHSSKTVTSAMEYVECCQKILLSGRS